MDGSTTKVILRRSSYDIYTAADLFEELKPLSPGRCVVDFQNVEYLVFKITTLDSIFEVRAVNHNG
jgi:hypothetical protein